MLFNFKLFFLKLVSVFVSIQCQALRLDHRLNYLKLLTFSHRRLNYLKFLAFSHLFYGDLSFRSVSVSKPFDGKIDLFDLLPDSSIISFNE